MLGVSKTQSSLLFFTCYFAGASASLLDSRAINVTTVPKCLSLAQVSPRTLTFFPTAEFTFPLGHPINISTRPKSNS